MYPGKDHIGVGCGAVILNEKNEVLLMKRGKACRSKVGWWSIPGGAVEFFEKIEDALKREVKEEVGLDIEIIKTLCLTEYFNKEEGQHWVSPQYLCKIMSGTIENKEPEKCEEIAWFNLDKLPEKLVFPAVNALDALKNNST
ncbi:NUDIX domain-containing protein [Candidatus Woesearchaeota archaeon]|nr:NUDIX domain-containing protein [Candidatus Woesearchaeota archaeon]